MNNYTDFELEKRKTMKLAADLGYGDKVVEEIRNAKTEFEIQKILITARSKKK